MKSYRVLIVDDNPVNLTLARYVLVNGGFIVDETTDGDSVMEKASTFGPDLILMDIQLGSTDGLELTRRLKAHPETSGIVIVAFTAHAMLGDESTMRAAGCDGYIAKPFDVLSIAEEVRAYLIARASP